MDPPRLEPALGNYAAGERFWDRTREVSEICAYLAEGHGVLLTGPRRVGKTSIVHRVLETMMPRTATLFVDVEQHADPTEMFAAIAAARCTDAAFWGRMRTWFGGRLGAGLDRIESVDVGVVTVELRAAMAGSWRDDARAILGALAAGGPTVLAVDELPLLVDRILKRDPAEAELFLGVLRAAAEGVTGVTWLVSGSVGLEPILHRAGLTGMITYLRAYPIDAWDEATTTGAVAALARARGLRLSAPATASVHATLGLGVPYHVQLLMDEVRRDATRRGDDRVSTDDIARVYEGPFLTSAVRAHLLHLETRLRTVLGEGDEMRLARDLLTQAAVVGLLEPSDAAWLADDLVEDKGRRAAALREVLDILEHDAYFDREQAGWQFRSRLVRDWWRRGNELGFVSVADRRADRDRENDE